MQKAALTYLFMKIKIHTVFTLQIKLFKSMLIYYFEFKNSHYLLIKDFNRFMTNKRKHHGKNNFADVV